MCFFDKITLNRKRSLKINKYVLNGLFHCQNLIKLVINSISYYIGKNSI